MQDIYFYTPEFELIHVESKVTSMQWHLKYADVGTMELHTDKKSKLANKLLPYGDKDFIVTQEDNAAWVNGVTDLGGTYDLGVYGRTLNHMLVWRVVSPFTLNYTIETIIRQKVTEKFITAGNNKIDNFILGLEMGGTSSTTYTLEDKQIMLLELVKGLCGIDKLGFKVEFNTDIDKYVFNIYKGLNRTAEQTERKALIFSQDEKNINDIKYTFMAQDYYSVGYVKEKINATETTEEIITFNEIVKDNVTGFKRREMLLNTDNEDEVKAKLEQAKKIEQLEGEVRNIKHGIDYNLGDLVTVQSKIGNQLIVQNKRIVEVVQVHEPLNSYEKPIFEVVI